MSTIKVRTLRSRPAPPPAPAVPVNARRETEKPSPELETAEAETSRKPSPMREEMPSPMLETTEELIPVMPPPYGENPSVQAAEDNRASTDVEDSSDEDDDKESNPRWSSVRRGCAQSLDSARKNLRNKKLVYLQSSTLSTEQEKPVDAAAELLTEEQKRRVLRRQIALQDDEGNMPSTSRDKGKAVDPRNWGNAGIDPEEWILVSRKR